LDVREVPRRRLDASDDDDGERGEAHDGRHEQHRAEEFALERRLLHYSTTWSTWPRAPGLRRKRSRAWERSTMVVVESGSSTSRSSGSRKPADAISYTRFAACTPSAV